MKNFTIFAIPNNEVVPVDGIQKAYFRSFSIPNPVRQVLPAMRSVDGIFYMNTNQLRKLGYAERSIKEYKDWHKKKPKKQAKPKKPVKKLSKQYLAYLESPQWAQIKLDLYEIRGRKCEICLKSGDVDVHHKTYKNFMKEEPEDLILVCRPCHEKIHGRKF